VVTLLVVVAVERTVQRAHLVEAVLVDVVARVVHYPVKQLLQILEAVAVELLILVVHTKVEPAELV
jgi:hypothetical protein